jgi:hypothetical protein
VTEYLILVCQRSDPDLPPWDHSSVSTLNELLGFRGHLLVLCVLCTCDHVITCRHMTSPKVTIIDCDCDRSVYCVCLVFAPFLLPLTLQIQHVCQVLFANLTHLVISEKRGLRLWHTPLLGVTALPRGRSAIMCRGTYHHSHLGLGLRVYKNCQSHRNDS